MMRTMLGDLGTSMEMSCAASDNTRPATERMIRLSESAEVNGRNEPYVLQTQTAFPKEAAMSAMELDPIARRAAT
jgi:hypothetical protein